MPEITRESLYEIEYQGLLEYTQPVVQGVNNNLLL